MNIQTKYLSVQKTARYSTYGELSEKTKYFWFVLHGSNMLCEQMLYKFADFDPQLHYVVAPEGLSRLYSKGLTGEVYATWMTKRDRLQEINDFSNYLTALLQQEQGKLNPTTKTILMGFSQGGTTLFRWLHAKNVVFDHLIGYSCWVPEDIDLSSTKSSFDDPKCMLTYGLQDQYLNDHKIEALKKVLSKNNMNPHFEPHPGEHRVSKDQLKYLYNKYIR